jgi:3-hydroxybutyrate dehydrogenase
VVNNAGTQFVSPVESFPLDKWEFILNLNLSAPFRLIQNVLPLMREQQFGRIINIASAHGLVASKHKAAYVAAKHGLVGLTKVVALETAQENITVNAICPGWVLTPLVQAQIDKIALDNNLSNVQASKKLLCEKQPSEEFVLPQQVGALAVFLSSDDAAQITGTTHSIDGGWTAQ